MTNEGVNAKGVEGLRVHDAAVSRVRLARDRALDLAGSLLAILDRDGGTTIERDDYREELDRLRRMAERSDAYLTGRPPSP